MNTSKRSFNALFKMIWILTFHFTYPTEIFGQTPRIGPVIDVADFTVDLGTLYDGDIGVAVFQIKNIGTDDLMIEKTSTECGCTVVQLSEDSKIIPPGSDVDLKVNFDSKGRSSSLPQTKRIKVHTNAVNQPEIQLEFTVLVESLYRLSPSSFVNLKNVPRGTQADRTLDVYPGSVNKPAKILSVDFNSDIPISTEIKPFDERGQQGERVLFTVSNDASLGHFLVSGIVKIQIEDQVRTHPIDVSVDVVGELIYQPFMVNMATQKLLPGKYLTPITITSTSRVPFKIIQVEGGPWLNVTVKAGKYSDDREYVVQPQVREDAPIGPFGTAIRIHTDLLDQPLITVPVFGQVASLIEIDPPIILMRDDGTPKGTRRLMQLTTLGPAYQLDIRSIHCDSPFLRVEPVEKATPAQSPHVKHFKISLVKRPPSELRQLTIEMETSIPGAEKISIPITIIKP